MPIPERFRQTGISLIELIMFIVIVGVGVTGVLSVMNVSARHSADPMLRKQAQSIAEALLEEIEMQPFTWCDPDDANAASAAGPAQCSVEDKLGPENETRYAEPHFDHVNDYSGFSMSPIVDISKHPVIGLGAYTATVNIAQTGAAFALPPEDVLQIDVRVQSGDADITLTGYRFRYAPNAVP